jgi:hypothetical protein
LLAGIVSEPSGLRLIELLLTYLARAAPRMTEEALRQVASMAGPQAEHIAMTLAETLYNKGVRKGVKQGVRQGVRQGVDRGKRELLARLVGMRFGRLPRWAAQRLRDATGQELEVWAGRMLVASSMEEIFERE